MKKTNVFVLTIITALLFAACGAPADNKPANTTNSTNANVSKPVAAAPTADALLAMDKQANDAYMKGDSKFFEGFLSDKFVMYPAGHRTTKADAVNMISKVKCDVKEWNLDEPQMAMIDADTYVLSYKGTFDGTCNDGPGGKAMKLPSPVRSASVYVRSGDKWMAVFHGENKIVEPKDTSKPEAKSSDKKDVSKKEIAKAEEPKKEEATKEEAKKIEPKKEEAKKDEAKKDDKAANANTAAPAKPMADANTDALVKLHTSGWEAWKAKDAKKFEELLPANVSIVDPVGLWISGKAAIVKHWIEEMKCEGVNNVKVSDGFASALSPTVEILTLKGTADGSCGGQKNAPIYQTAVYIKEGDAWKLAFMFESPAGK